MKFPPENARSQPCITMGMRIRWVVAVLFGLVMAMPSPAADGTFRGKVIDPPNTHTTPGWIFVQGRNQMLRRVEVAHAVIVFGEDVPASQRRKCNAECLIAGQEVLVTARQDSAGEWRAKRVEILKMTTNVARAGEIPVLYENLPLLSSLSR